jgi:hypothetical protein
LTALSAKLLFLIYPRNLICFFVLKRRVGVTNVVLEYYSSPPKKLILIHLIYKL